MAGTRPVPWPAPLPLPNGGKAVCGAQHDITAEYDEVVSYLMCDLGPHAEGAPHHDPGDDIWWLDAGQEPDAVEFPATVAGGHALIVEFGDEETLCHCQCGDPLDNLTIRPDQSLDILGLRWERHVMSLWRGGNPHDTGKVSQ